MITFITGNWGDKYPVEYIERLERMILRHCPGDINFRVLREFPCDPHEGTWAKMHLFNREMYAPHEARQVHIWLDLDVVITGDLTVFSELIGPVLHISDGFRDGTKDGVNSSVMAFVPEDVFGIWDTWVRNGKVLMGHGDQDIIREITGAWKHIWRGLTCSYKLDVLTGRVPKDSRVVVFHGHPNPHEVPDDPIVKEHWYGAGS